MAVARSAVAATAVLLATLAGPAAANEPALVLERRIALAEVTGRIDHMAFEPRRQRLLVAAFGNDSLDVVDLATAQPVHRISGLAHPQGVAYAPAADAILVANGGDGSVRFFRAGDFAQIGAIALGDDADDAASDPTTGYIVVGFGRGGLAVIDPLQHLVAATVSLAAHPEAFRLDPVTQRGFVNVPDAGEIAVVDLHSRRQVGAWRVAGVAANFPMALDPDARVLASAFRAPARLVLFDTTTGGVIAQRPTCGDADDVFFDRRRHRLYVSCGAGAVDVFRRRGASLDRIARIATAPGARTSLFVPEVDRLFVAAGAATPGGAPAAILVFRPAP